MKNVIMLFRNRYVNNFNVNIKISLILFPLIFIIIIASCKPNTKSITQKVDQKPEIDKVLHINLPDTENGKCFVSSIASKIEYIPLETNEESLFKLYRMLIEMNDSLIVLSDQDRILLFNRQDGKFIRKIGNKGKGPGEFGKIFKMILQNDTLYVTSSNSYSVIKYTLNGQYQGYIDMGIVNLFYFTCLPNGMLASYDHNNGNILFFDVKGEIKNTLQIESNVHESREYGAFIIPNDNYFFRINERVLFTTYTNDTIWDITSMAKQPAIIFNLNDKLLNYDDQLKLGFNNPEKYMNEFEKHYKLDLVQSDSLIFVYTANYHNSDAKLYSYNKMRGKIQNFGKNRIYDDLHGSQSLTLYAIQNNKIICFEDYSDLRKKYDNASTKEEKIFWGELHAKVKESDNPCLVIITIK
jgi:hypothetical protein